MAGHSKWANIKNRKGAQDAKRAKIFYKLSREIMVAVQKGGGDPSSNPILRLAVAKARAQSMPKKNIDTAIDKAAGVKGGSSYQEHVFAGNVSGVSFLVECLTDNIHRTTSEIQHLFSKAGGALAGVSSVSHIFVRTGVLELPQSAVKNFDELMIMAIDAGADDLEEGESSYFIYTTPHNLPKVREALETKYHLTGFTTAESRYLPSQEVLVNRDKAESILEFIDKIEDHDDVQAIYHNLDIESLN